MWLCGIEIKYIVLSIYFLHLQKKASWEPLSLTGKWRGVYEHNTEKKVQAFPKNSPYCPLRNVLKR